MLAFVLLPTNPTVAKEFQYSAGLHLGLVPHEEDDPSAKAYSTDFVSLHLASDMDRDIDDSWA